MTAEQVTAYSFAPNPAYQAEVKYWLVKRFFHPANGWTVNCHIDPMERAHGGAHAEGKAERARLACDGLKALGVSLGMHQTFGKVDVVAEHQREGLRLVEVEADTSRQREQCLYSALGQVVLSMRLHSEHVRYGLAVPRTREWLSQLRKIPKEVAKVLRLDLYAVAGESGELIQGGLEMPRLSR